MASKQQEEKLQKTLRKLLTLPENKKCFDCTEKGPFYACTTLGIFVCPTCSGIHREFNHRVKSISMANFKPEEVQLLQEMGNGRAREIWLATWTPEDFPEPDPTDKTRIREFMKLKYEAKRWYKKSRSREGRSSSPREGEKKKKKSPRTRGVHTVPETEPLESILGPHIPPIQISQNSNGAVDPRQKKGGSNSNMLVWDEPAAPPQAPKPASSHVGQPPAGGQQGSLSALEGIFAGAKEPAKPQSTLWPPPQEHPTQPFNPMMQNPFAVPQQMPAQMPQINPLVFQQLSPQQQQQYLQLQQQWLQQQQMLLAQRMGSMSLNGPSAVPPMQQQQQQQNNPFWSAGVGPQAPMQPPVRTAPPMQQQHYAPLSPMGSSGMMMPMGGGGGVGGSHYQSPSAPLSGSSLMPTASAGAQTQPKKKDEAFAELSSFASLGKGTRSSASTTPSSSNSLLSSLSSPPSSSGGVLAPLSSGAGASPFGASAGAAPPRQTPPAGGGAPNPFELFLNGAGAPGSTGGGTPARQEQPKSDPFNPFGF